VPPWCAELLNSRPHDGAADSIAKAADMRPYSFSCCIDFANFTIGEVKSLAEIHGESLWESFSETILKLSLYVMSDDQKFNGLFCIYSFIRNIKASKASYNVLAQ